MLFDLRGSGRQRVVKVVYVTLAFLIGGGLVFFGIGNSGIGGGLFDAITSTSGTTDASTNRLRKQESALVLKVGANRQDAQAYADLALVRTKLANQGEFFDSGANNGQGDYTAKGKAKLGEAAAAWERYLSLHPKTPDDRVARVMVTTYEVLNKLDKAVEAQEIVAESVNKAAPYAQLASIAYAAGQTRKGDLAKDKALALTPKDMDTIPGFAN